MIKILEIERANNQGVDRYYRTPYPGIYIHEFEYPGERTLFSAGRVENGKNYNITVECKPMGMIPTIESPSVETIKEAEEQADRIATGNLLDGETIRESGTNAQLFREIGEKLKQSKGGENK